MRTIEQILNNYVYPTSSELISLARHDSQFAKTTRFVSTFEGAFKVSSEDFKNCTWSFTSLEKKFSSVATACDEFSKHFNGKRVQCNAYYTPPKSQGLPVHYDLHDVFVLQLEGSKEWKLWPAFRKKVSKTTLLYDEKENLHSWISSVEAKDQTLKMADVLFLKTGEPHAAFATEQYSLHLSFGVYND